MPGSSVVRWVLFVLLFLTAGCGEGYWTPRAVLWVEFTSIPEMRAAAIAIEDAFVARGFRATHPRPPFVDPAGSEQFDYWQRTRIQFWQRRETTPFQNRDMSLSLTPYPDADLRYCGFGPCGREPDWPHYPFIEIAITDERPGGFSADGMVVYGEILSLLERLGGKVVVAVKPPPADEAKHDRVVTNNAITGIVWWFIAWAIYAVVIVWTCVGILRVYGFGAWSRRMAVVVLGVACATPLPASGGFFSFYIPAVLWLPSSVGLYGEYAEKFGVLLPGAFGVSLVLSLLAALFVRDRPAREGAG